MAATSVCREVLIWRTFYAASDDALGRLRQSLIGGVLRLPKTRRRTAMTTYVMLANWTEQGILKAKDSPRRLDAAKKALKDMSGEFKSFYLTLGDYDMVAIFEAPDDAVAARFSLQLGMQGSVRTRTLKAFPEAAYREIINSLG
jgi:uncharacterized protein with GYD domain